MNRGNERALLAEEQATMEVKGWVKAFSWSLIITLHRWRSHGRAFFPAWNLLIAKWHQKISKKRLFTKEKEKEAAKELRHCASSGQFSVFKNLAQTMKYKVKINAHNQWRESFPCTASCFCITPKCFWLLIFLKRVGRKTLSVKFQCFLRLA